MFQLLCSQVGSGPAWLRLRFKVEAQAWLRLRLSSSGPGSPGCGSGSGSGCGSVSGCALSAWLWLKFRLLRFGSFVGSVPGSVCLLPGLASSSVVPGQVLAQFSSLRLWLRFSSFWLSSGSGLGSGSGSGLALVLVGFVQALAHSTSSTGSNWLRFGWVLEDKRISDIG